MTGQQAAEWAELQSDPSLSYGTSPIGTGFGPIMGGGGRGAPPAGPPAPLSSFDQIRADVRAPRAPLEGLATGPGMTPQEELDVLFSVILVASSVISLYYSYKAYAWVADVVETVGAFAGDVASEAWGFFPRGASLLNLPTTLSIPGFR